jgi:hypothetical protein
MECHLQAKCLSRLCGPDRRTETVRELDAVNYGKSRVAKVLEPGRRSRRRVLQAILPILRARQPVFVIRNRGGFFASWASAHRFENRCYPAESIPGRSQANCHLQRALTYKEAKVSRWT